LVFTYYADSLENMVTLNDGHHSFLQQVVQTCQLQNKQTLATEITQGVSTLVIIQILQCMESTACICIIKTSAAINFYQQDAENHHGSKRSITIN